MGRGKIGDVVLTRVNGEQVTRVRNRFIRNPQTDAQMYQRAIIATVTMAYAAGKEILDHSFQGIHTGADSMAYFLSEASKTLRNTIKEDIDQNRNLLNQRGVVVAPKSTTPVPILNLPISKGQLTNDVFTTQWNNTRQEVTFSLKGAGNVNGKTQKQFFEEIGVRAGDIFTIVAYINTTDKVFIGEQTGSDLNSQFGCLFGFSRLTALEPSNEIIRPEDSIDELFLREADGRLFDKDVAVAEIHNYNDLSILDLGINKSVNYKQGTVAIIRSREDSKTRSTERMRQIGEPYFGIKTGYLLDVWKPETTALGASELILEGKPIQ